MILYVSHASGVTQHDVCCTSCTYSTGDGGADSQTINGSSDNIIDNNVVCDSQAKNRHSVWHAKVLRAAGTCCSDSGTTYHRKHITDSVVGCHSDTDQSNRTMYTCMQQTNLACNSACTCQQCNFIALTSSDSAAVSSNDTLTYCRMTYCRNSDHSSAGDSASKCFCTCKHCVSIEVSSHAALTRNSIDTCLHDGSAVERRRQCDCALGMWKPELGKQTATEHVGGSYCCCRCIDIRCCCGTNSANHIEDNKQVCVKTVSHHRDRRKQEGVGGGSEGRGDDEKTRERPGGGGGGEGGRGGGRCKGRTATAFRNQSVSNPCLRLNCRRLSPRLQTLLPLLFLTLMSSTTPAGAVNLPVSMPPHHPSQVLSATGHNSGFTSDSARALTSNAVESGMEPQQAIREAEVMYHFYKNGRMGSVYHRRASTVFMVNLFNDLLKGSPSVRSHMTPPARQGKNGKASGGEEDQPASTDTIRSFSAGEVRYTKKKKATVTFFIPFLPPNEQLRSAELRFLRQKTGSRRSSRRKRFKLRVDIYRGGKRVEKNMLRERVNQQEDYDVFDVTRLLDSWINTHHGNVSLRVRIPRKLEEKIVLSDSSFKSTSLVALYLKDSDFLKNMFESYTTDDDANDVDYEDDEDYDRNNSSSEGRESDARRASRAKRDIPDNLYAYIKNSGVGDFNTSGNNSGSQLHFRENVHRNSSNNEANLSSDNTINDSSSDYFDPELIEFLNKYKFDSPLSRDLFLQKHGRSKREASASSKSRRNPRNGGSKRKRWYKAPKHDECQMYDFKVDFDLIGWGQWIIHPKQFNAGFCYGECPSPVDTKFKPTNHAMLQTLMRQKRPRLAPPTCCVPIRLQPLSMLYFEYDEIVVRHHENMVAAECGCR